MKKMMMSSDVEKERLDWGWLIPVIRNLKHEAFTGNIRINFHKGHLSKKVKKTTLISEK